MRIPSVPNGARRRGIDPVIAELLLIVVSLIAGVALAGFVFGTLGVYAHSAEVAAQVTSCAADGASDEVCRVNLTNVGSSNVATTSACTINVGGGKLIGTVGFGGSIPAGGSLRGVSCTDSGGLVAAGSTVVGSIFLTNGASVLFAGTSS